MKRWLFFVVAVLLTFAAPALAGGKIKVGIMSDSEDVWAKVKAIAAKDGLDLDLVVFSDYLLPNAALDAGDLQANAFQHKPFLENQITAKGYKIVPVGATIVSPIGLYSRRVKAVGDLKAGAKIGIPNDPSNGGRALLLLQAQKLIKLKDGVGILPTVLDVTDNPKTLQFREIDAAQLSRSLDDLDAAVINTNYAVEAGLKPGKDSIAIESSVDNPYSNFIAVRETDKNAPWVPKLVHAYQNDTIRAYITDKRPGEVPAF
ncbi:MetQ/NlpA family ABC transporter substrate-binding protein [Methylobacterium mesophilicum]|uniref:MetQ/NlpA family ABC transporter substrate-binding protein n=1 Tax=Methylobacterium TaxID=407 RepID=UPI0011CCA710|nr:MULTISPECIES: MetQ/NlpA family ABC transporter substrate-binding protein [Methylobacterium]TXN47755.1 MetQ/NlpA family ABC transporter substrate-binding protein [Methylobacterium sp. WL7]GJE22553.1 D-methionine-binding lipoprotein MetQ [Methylobacterium mesophilicum]